MQCSGSVTFRILGSVHCITEPDLALFITGIQDAKKKNYIKILSFFAYYRYFHCSVDAFTSVFKENNSLRSHKTVEIKVFLNFFCLSMKG
jgi:hypothetical protein